MLNRLRPTAGGGKAQASPPRWRNKGYRCIGGVLYKVSANKLSKTSGRPGGEGATRPLPRTGEAPWRWGPGSLWAWLLTPHHASSIVGGCCGSPVTPCSQGADPRERFPNGPRPRPGVHFPLQCLPGPHSRPCRSRRGSRSSPGTDGEASRPPRPLGKPPRALPLARPSGP